MSGRRRAKTAFGVVGGSTTRPAMAGTCASRACEPSDYQIAVLEVAGSEQTRVEIQNIEQRWVRKLQSSEMGLNS